MMRGLVTAIRTLTLIPVPGRDTASLAGALSWFALVGGLLGSLLWGLALLLGRLAPDWPAAQAGMILVVGSWVTGFLHLDGLADAADGLLGGRDRESILRILRDHCVGAFGAVALILILLAKWICLTRLTQGHALAWLPVAWMAARSVQVELTVTMSYARNEPGKAGPFVQDACLTHRLWAWGTTVLATVILRGPIGLGVLVLAWVGARLLGCTYQRRIQGVTGDLLGAASELIETGVLFAGGLIGHWGTW